MSAWQPNISLQHLQQRAAFTHKVRSFFISKNILEVQTPLLQPYSVTDPYIDSIKTTHGFLQTSPEYAMKRLLAFHKQSIYQICKAFREEETSPWHANEFTMLEWYVVNATMHDLIEQVIELILYLEFDVVPLKTSYRDLFLKYIQLDPFKETKQTFYQLLLDQNKLPVGISNNECLDTYLQIIMSEMIEPQLPVKQATIVFDYPQGQSALARLANRSYGTVAERFELYLGKVECGNGFHELLNAEEQLQRFQQNQLVREQNHSRPMQIDPLFIAALEHGLPSCSGIAIGLDRLFMIKHDIKHIEQSIF